MTIAENENDKPNTIAKYDNDKPTTKKYDEINDTEHPIRGNTE